MPSEASPNAAQPSSRRRWYQFSLRTLLLVVTLAGCGFGWFGAKLRRARLQHLAVERLQSCGATVIYDYEPRDADIAWYRSSRPTAVEPPGPAWLRAILGMDFFANVVEVDLHDGFQPQQDASDAELWQQLRGLKRLSLEGFSDLDEQVLGRLPELPQVEELYVRESTNQGLRYIIKRFPRLKSLTVMHAFPSEATVEDLDGLVGLEELSMCYLTDSNLRLIARLPNLRSLDLCFCDSAITDAGMARLLSCGKLKTLLLDYTKVTDAALLTLAKRPDLESLSIGGTGVTADGLKNLKPFRNLTTLGVDSKLLTDVGIAHLQDLASLKALDIVTTLLLNQSDPATDEERQALCDRVQKALPNATIKGVMR